MTINHQSIHQTNKKTISRSPYHQEKVWVSSVSPGIESLYPAQRTCRTIPSPAKAPEEELICKFKIQIKFTILWNYFNSKTKLCLLP